MRQNLAAVSGFAGLALLLAGSFDANPVRASGNPRFRVAPFVSAMAPRRAALHTRNRFAAYTCITNDAMSFRGTGENNVTGGQFSAIVGGSGNQACDDAGAIVAGDDNAIGGAANGATLSFIGAGEENNVTAGLAAIVGGYGEVASGIGSFIGAGGYSSGGNIVSGADSAVVDGDQNANAGADAFIGSGVSNRITNTGADGVLDGGFGNSVSGPYASIGGGSGNKASGAFAVIPGGADDEAMGAASFAAGYHAEATHNGSFVWSDDVSGSSLVADPAANQFVIRASGGTYVYSTETLTAGVKLAAGSGTWSSLSDRNAKTDVAALDDASILAKVAALPVSSWQYETERGVRHVGPMAQDFYAAFGVGEDNRHITSIDEDGVALAAIKGFHAMLEGKNGQIAALHRENSSLAARLRAVESKDAALERRLDAIAARLTTRFSVERVRTVRV